MRTRGGVQNCRTRDAAHTSHSQLKETMDNNAGSNEKQKDIIEKSAADSSEQQYVSIDNGNASKSSVDINISDTTAVDIDIRSKNESDDKTSNDTWSKDDPIIKTFPFNKNASLKIFVPKIKILFSVSNFWFRINSWVKLFKGRMSMHVP